MYCIRGIFKCNWTVNGHFPDKFRGNSDVFGQYLDSFVNCEVTEWIFSDIFMKMTYLFMLLYTFLMLAEPLKRTVFVVEMHMVL